MKEKLKNFRLPGLAGIALLVGAAMLLLWLAAMIAVTNAMAIPWYDQCYNAQLDLVDRIGNGSQMAWLAQKQYADQDSMRRDWVLDRMVWEAINYGQITYCDGFYYPISKTNSYALSRDRAELVSAVLVADKDGNILARNGNYIHFAYTDQAGWDSLKSPAVGYGVLRMEDVPALEALYTSDLGFPDQPELLRVVGVPNEYGLFEPWRVDYCTQKDIENAHRYQGSYTYQGLMAEGKLSWTCALDRGTPPGNAVTVYSTSVVDYTMYEYAQRPVVFWDVEYESVNAALEALWARYQDPATRDDVLKSAYQRQVDNNAMFRVEHYRDYRDYVPNPDTDPDPLFTVAVLSFTDPLAAARASLTPVYRTSAIAALVIGIFLTRLLYVKLVEPLQHVHRAVKQDSRYELRDPHGLWGEHRDLFLDYEAQRQTTQKSRYELNRLETALNYAEKAEEIRRHTTSALAHELKTPLAVVHSYAEGLQLGIAGEKTGVYLDTILRESEKMDALVMEMLDFSRLESGRVQIARDRVELGALTKGIFDKLSPLAQERGLTVALDWESEFFVTADEARLGQAVQNFASNAVKYTPEGGRITVTLRRDRKEVRLSVWNSLDAPLPGEVLAKVWEPFFRADESRTARGTGLGLAITRQIVQLHGGTVSARNMNDGIQFTMTLPG